MGTVLDIYIASVKGGPMQLRAFVRAIKGVGLEGDRYANADGAFSKRKPGEPVRNVTLIASEAIAAAGSECDGLYEANETRRNIVTEGVDLNDLVGKNFLVGEVLLRGTELCHPCLRPGKLKGEDGTAFKEAFKNRGGLCAEILSDGEIAVGAEIVLLP